MTHQLTRRARTLIGIVALAVPATLGILTATPPSHAAPTPQQSTRHLSTRVDVLKSQIRMDHRHEKWYLAKIDALHNRIEHPNTPAVSTSSTSTTSSTGTLTSTTSYPSGHSGCLTATEVANYARGAGFPESAISTMVYYASRESGYCPGAINSSSGACGLWQLYPCVGGSAWLDPATNAHYAYEKYKASGFSPWGG